MLVRGYECGGGGGKCCLYFLLGFCLSEIFKNIKWEVGGTDYADVGILEKDGVIGLCML